MRQLLRLERRLQDLERRLENTVRRGKVKDVKFNTEEKRWYVQMEDGEAGKEHYFRTDWVPWESFSHGSIRISTPPRKGQAVAVHSPNGEPEVCYAKPYHNTKEAPSPHDKQDEMVIEVLDPEDETQKVRMIITKDNLTITRGKSKLDLTKDKVEVDHDGQKTTVDKDGTRLQNSTGTVHVKPNGKIDAKNTSGSVVLAENGNILLNC